MYMLKLPGEGGPTLSKMLRRGGTRRFVVQEVPDQDLLHALHSHVQEVGVKGAFCLGMYEHLDRSQAIHVPGLHSNKSLLLNLLSVAPWAELKACQLKKSLRCLLGVHPSLNVSQLNTELWCGLKASQVATMLTHLRRFKTDLVKRTEAVKKATKEEECSMQEILAIMEQETYIYIYIYTYIYIYIQATFAPIVRFAAAVPLFFALRAGCGWYI